MTSPSSKPDPYHARRARRTSLTRILGWLLLALLLGALALAIDGQELPEAPKPQPDHLERSLLVADASMRALDIYSTHRMLARGNHEVLLPQAIAGHTWSMTAYSAGTVALDWWTTRRLEQRGHRRLARLVTLIDLGQDAPWAIHNLWLKKQETKTLQLKGRP